MSPGGTSYDGLVRVPQHRPETAVSKPGTWREGPPESAGGSADLRSPEGPRAPKERSGSEGSQPHPGPRRSRRPLPVALLHAMRPRQWVKNLLVFAAPAAAGVVFHSGPFARCVAAFFIFTAASSATYLVNDIVDRDADRLHPVKRHRPIASDQVSPPVAWVAAAVLLAGSLAGAAALAGGVLVGVVGAYVVITLAYSFGLKHVPVIELACVASGFVLRAVAGGAAVHVPLSPWFLLVTSFGALFIVAGKRSAEHEVMGEERAVHRAALGEYPAPFLRMVRMLAASVAVTAYCLWAFDRAGHLSIRNWNGHLVWFELSIIPFQIGRAHV